MGPGGARMEEENHAARVGGGKKTEWGNFPWGTKSRRATPKKEGRSTGHRTHARSESDMKTTRGEGFAV